MEPVERLTAVVENYVVENFTIEGTPLSIMKNSGAPTASIILCFRDGVPYEPVQWGGISHFVEHILFRGTEKYPTLYDISRRVEGMGGLISAYSTRDMTAFWVKIPPGCEENGLEILGQLISKPLLNPDFIEAEKKIIHQERHREINNPAFYSSLMIENLLLLPDPISRHPVGEDGIIEKIDRDILKDYIQRYYGKRNMSAAASGNISPEFPDVFSRFLREMSPGEKGIPADFRIDSRAAGEPVVLNKTHHRSQVYLAMGWKFNPEKADDVYAWRVLAALLGTGYTGIFNRVLREQENITYLCTTGFNIYENTAVFKLNMALADENLEKSLFLVDNIIEDVKEKRIPEDIFKEAVTRHTAAVVFKLENSMETARVMGHTLLREGRPFSFKEYIEKVGNVTLDHISRQAGQYLIENNRKIFIQTGSEKVHEVFSGAFIPPVDTTGAVII